MNPTTPAPAAHQHTPQEIRLRSGLDVPTLLLPDPARLFAERALRLRQLAAGHAMRDYLLLLALVCEAQHSQAQQFPALTVPTAAPHDAARQAGAPPPEATRWPREPLWRAPLRALLQQVLDQLPGDSPARAAIQATRELPDEVLEQQADRLLAGITLGLDMAAAPLIAAGLQLYFTHGVAASAAVQPNAFAVAAHAPLCPCCGTPPVASITRLGGPQEGQRYLLCSLCNVQWHMPRIQCTHCGTAQGIEYQSLQPVSEHGKTDQRPAVEAETCQSCRHYLKIVHMARDLHVEPLADDLATLTLDLLVSEAGFERHGVNLLLLFGDGDAQAGGD